MMRRIEAGGVLFVIIHQVDGKRWIEVPPLTLEDEVDVEHMSELMQRCYSFIIGDIEMDEV